MSLIFDALQRSEAERSGLDLSALSAVTDVLQRAEIHATSEREDVSLLPQPLRTQSAQNGASPPSGDLFAESPNAEPSPSDEQPAVLGQFHRLQLVIPPAARLVCYTDGESLAAEKFRFLGVSLQLLRRDRPLKKVLITSTIPQEGKSTVSANLACSLARTTRQRVLLIEGDVRRPALSQMFGLERLPGISECLQKERDLTSSIYHLEGPRLWFLPAGSAPKNPLEILQSEKLSPILEQLTSWFDWIIIDSPPVMPLADTSVWMRLADGILLVVRQGITEKRQLERGIDALEPKKLIGAVLNGSKRQVKSDYYYSKPQP
jgi:capsular exopolysaccharide synthesis family protein